MIESTVIESTVIESTVIKVRQPGADVVELLDQLALRRAQVIETALVDCGVASVEQAELGLHAFAQWFNALPHCPPGARMVMLKGPVDQLWHALILHTRLYRELCEHHLGFFLDHQPQPGDPPRPWVVDTVRHLTRRYGGELNPLFDDWLAPSSPLAGKEVP